jgi:hypothetical protein
MEASDSNANLLGVTSIFQPEETHETDNQTEETPEIDQQTEATQETDQQTTAEEVSHSSDVSENNELDPDSLSHNSTSAPTKQSEAHVRTSILEHIACFLVGKSRIVLRKLVMVDALELCEDDTETPSLLILSTSVLFCINLCIEIFIAVGLQIVSLEFSAMVLLLLFLFLFFVRQIKCTSTQWYFIRAEIAQRREKKAKESQGAQSTKGETDRAYIDSLIGTRHFAANHNAIVQSRTEVENLVQQHDVELEVTPPMRVDTEADIGLVPSVHRTDVAIGTETLDR